MIPILVADRALLNHRELSEVALHIHPDIPDNQPAPFTTP